MNLHDKSWNAYTVRQVFSADIADKILHTPLIPQVDADKVIWKAERLLLCKNCLQVMCIRVG